MKWIVVVVVTVLSAGCASPEQYRETLKTWVGTSEADLVAKWGAPDTSYRADDGTRLLTYSRVRKYDAEGVTLTGRCKTTFRVEQGTVTGFSFQGNECK